MSGYWTTQYVPAYTNHLLHFAVTVASFGLWGFVWIPIAIYNQNRMVPKRVWMQAVPQMPTRWGYPPVTATPPPVPAPKP